ncbi:serine protease [Permianibacter aggregans]|uniref:Trypsin-like peptidase n=2 Tax=Permianibacter aggregans TaxID=1510150 RepID=A0A4R6UQ02_9GAMM|nr:serine protease [Permianibacter aggregans]TDQ49091.1 trypsin-like peptidase [Permianibacter aggregans]
MKRIFMSALLAVSACLPAVSTAADLPDAIAQAKSSIVGVGTQLMTRRPPALLRGTGFVVADGKHVLTNYHVLPEVLDSEHREVLVVFSGSGDMQTLHTARVIASDAEHDLALLRIDGRPLPALQLDADVEVREGESLLLTGFPVGAVLGLYPATSQAMVSAITPIAIPVPTTQSLNAASIKRLRTPYLVYQLDAIAYPGNSGSPLYRASDLKVVGVINAVLVKESKEAALERPTAISYAIPIKFALPLLEKIGSTP